MIGTPMPPRPAAFGQQPPPPLGAPPEQAKRVPTLYVRNLNEKVKGEGKCGFKVLTFRAQGLSLPLTFYAR